jgi:hypothetical protein
LFLVSIIAPVITKFLESSYEQHAGRGHLYVLLSRKDDGAFKLVAW